ncbi:MAG: cytidylyltransferase domain-containing protein [Planctomycetia bacterium]|jgi:CMP-N-acetylneuraminic acid synthetase/regulator of RNase E activity RraA
MKVVAIVPAKGSSERVANKNVRSFNGEPLFVYTVRKLLACDFIDEVYVDSDSEHILQRSLTVGAKIMRRAPALATNATDGHKLFLNEVQNISADIYVQHLCTSPFVEPETIERAVDAVLKNPQVDSAVLCRSDKYYWWRDGRPAYNIDNIPNSVDLPAEMSEAMALYVVRREAALQTGRRVGERPAVIIGKPLELVDVNTEDDLKLAEAIVRGHAAQERRVFQILSNILSSPLVSDVCDELGIEGFVPASFVPNFLNAKFIGRARPLHLRPSDSDDRPDAIYDALSSYSVVFENDVIVVQNDCPGLAYFGELNMSLAIRSGAVGAVIGGVTRDSWATSAASFPVFSLGYCAKDIKGKGAVASINDTITLCGRNVSPSDVIFADREGIIVLPYWKAEEVLRRSLEAASKEKRVLADIASGETVAGILDRHGFF